MPLNDRLSCGDSKVDMIAMFIQRSLIKVVSNSLVVVEPLGAWKSGIEDTFVDGEVSDLVIGCDLGEKRGRNFLVTDIDRSPFGVMTSSSLTH